MRIGIVIPFDGKKCNNGLGGLIEGAVIEFKNISTLTFTNKKLSDITLAVGTQFEVIKFNANNTATFNEAPPTRESSILNQNASGQFAGVTHDGILTGDGLNLICDGLFIIWRFANGDMRAQGVERIDDSGPDQWRQSIVEACAHVGSDHSTLNGKAFMPISIDSQAQFMAPFVDSTLLPWSDILAL